MIGRREVIIGGGAVAAAAAAAKVVNSLGNSPAASSSDSVKVVNGADVRAADTVESVQPADADLNIMTTNGPIYGQRIPGTNIRAFTNVRFGKNTGPDTGTNPGVGRFKAPIAPDYNSTPQDATGPAPWPAQAGGGGVEDCLKLNVWTPTVAPPAGGWPVLVYIYGGGNIGGSIVQPMYEGSTFAVRGVVCVCINYRVGPLGFLELGSMDEYKSLQGSGNNGLKDQLLGLKWVKDNIAAFNGNPNRVTIAGQSAGAGDCTTLYTLPEAQQYFQRAIIVSGGGGDLNEQSVAESYGAAFVAELRTPTGANPVAAAGGPLYASANQLVSAYKNTKRNGFSYAGSKRAGFITEKPIDTLENASSPLPKPLMIGFLRDEIATGVFPDTTNLDNISITNYDYNYFPDGTAAWASYQSVPAVDDHHRRVAYFSADKFKVPAIAIAQAAVRHGQSSVYVYEDRFPGRNGATNGYASHGGDIPFYFNHLDTDQAAKFGYTSADQPMADKVQTAWVRFIWGLSMSMDTAQWAPYTIANRAMMIIDSNAQIASDPIALERTKWVELGALKP